MNMNDELDFTDYLEIFRIFDENKWIRDEVNKKSLYNRYINRCKLLNESQRKLFYKLSYKFRCVELNEYIELLRKLLKNIIPKYFKGLKYVYVYPVKLKADEKKIKSSDLVLYLLNSLKLKYIDEIANVSFKLITPLENEKIDKLKNSNSPIILIDDFIGTGNYAVSVAKELIMKGISKSRIVISPLVISSIGLELLQKEEFIIEYAEVSNNILDSLSDKELKILDEIEKLFNLKDEFKHGFKGSGNIISLIRTPNNTLPMFYMKHGNVSNAPFQR